MPCKTTLLVLALLFAALISLSDASNYWRITKGRGHPRYAARSPRYMYNLRKSSDVKRTPYLENDIDSDIDTAENLVEDWLRDWVVENRDFIRNTLLEEDFRNEV